MIMRILKMGARLGRGTGRIDNADPEKFREYPDGGKDTWEERSAVRPGVSLCNEARVACVIGQI